MSRGKYIVIEGPEGVGKTTQIGLLSEKLQAAGLPVRIFREPDSQSDLTARAIRQLTQDPMYPMNTRTEVLLYNAARAQSLEVIKKSVEQGIICLADRNYLTTLAIQYYGRGDVPDYETINRIIRFAIGGIEPDLTIVLDAPVAELKQRTKARYQGDRFDNLDEAFLERVRAGYLWEAKQRELPIIFAVDNSDVVSQKVWELATQVLALREPSKAIAGSPISIKEVIAERRDQNTHDTSTDTLLTKNSNDEYQITKLGQDYLTASVTDTTGQVYAFKEKLSPIMIAAAMARLSRRADDMRVTILDEFAEKVGKDEKLLQRVITAYGDDSVQQLAGIHVVVEAASNILTKKLEWGRLAAYLEQSTRYIYFDRKDQEGRYRYYIPRSINKKTQKQYTETMDKIFDLYSEMVHKLSKHLKDSSAVPKEEQDGAWQGAIRAQACDAIRPVLPVATTATVGIYASAQALENLIMHLLSDELLEAREVGTKILDNARRVMPAFLERADKPDRGGATIAYRSNTFQAVKNFADRYLSDNHGSETEPTQLVSYWPKNELDLIPDMLYEHSSLSLRDIQKQVTAWTVKRKEKVFLAYMGERLNRRHKPGRALEKAHYSWDLFCDYGIFRDLQRHRMVDDLEWQLLTPRYGYDIPALVEEANLTELFENCFDLSIQLYSAMQAAGYGLEAQYATLLGHKMRWKVTYNAREAFHLHELRTSPQGHPGYRKLVQQMHEKLSEVHPLLAASMSFVNKGDDPELSRLAAERYTQFKLQQLS